MEYGRFAPAQIDFNAFDPVGNFEQGTALRRQRQLRAALSGIAPDDFQGMAKALMQFGEPEQGVRAMQLQNQLQHQAHTEDIAERTLRLNEGIRTDANARAEAEEQRRRAEYTLPANSLSSGLKDYPAVRSAILSPGIADWWGASSVARDNMQGMILSIAKANKFDATQTKALLDQLLINPSDVSIESRARKLKLFENYVGSTVQSLEAGAGPGAVNAEEFAIPEYVPPNTTVVPQGGAPGGAPQQAQTAPGPGGYQNRGPALPPNLSGEADIFWSESRQQFKNTRTGEIFDRNGTRINQVQTTPIEPPQ